MMKHNKLLLAALAFFALGSTADILARRGHGSHGGYRNNGYHGGYGHGRRHGGYNRGYGYSGLGLGLGFLATTAAASNSSDLRRENKRLREKVRDLEYRLDRLEQENRDLRKR